MSEFQAIILSGVEEAIELYPLTNGIPQPLLPVANIPMIEYQLEYLRKAKFSAVFLVVPEELQTHMKSYLNSYAQKQASSEENIIDIKLRLFDSKCVESTIDMLRSIREEISGDVIVLRGDVITDASLHNLADMHRINDCSLSLFLKELPSGKTVEETKKLRKRYQKKDIISYFSVVPPPVEARGAARNHNRLLFAKTLSAEDSFSISKALLNRENKMVIRTDLLDPHIYILNKWVFDLLCESQRFTSIQTDFLPYFLKLQYRNLSPEVSAVKNTDEELKCMSYIVPQRFHFCERVDTVNNYLLVNTEILNYSVSSTTPWPVLSKTKAEKEEKITLKNTLVHETASIGEGCILKDCIVGKDVVVEPGCRINNCVFMKNSIIKQECRIQRSIVCCDCIVGDRCVLVDCQMEAKASLPDNTEVKTEVILREEQDIVTF